MMVNVIKTTNPDVAMRMSMGGWQDESTQQYLQNNFNNFMNRAGQLANSFVDEVKQTFNYFNNSELIAKTKRLLTTSEVVMSDNVIYPVNMDTIHNPGYMMRRYIMAEPEIYTLYQKNRCSGYDDDWYDPEPEITDPYKRDDYLHAVDGVIQHDENGDGYVLFYSSDNPLSYNERAIVNTTWDTLKSIIATGMDPTDINRGEIG